MKLNPNANIPAFLQAVQKCKKEVYYTTPEGDKLALKSILSQFVFAAVLGSDLEEMRGDIELNDSQDAEFLSEYLTD